MKNIFVSIYFFVKNQKSNQNCGWGSPRQNLKKNREKLKQNYFLKIFLINRPSSVYHDLRAYIRNY